VAVLGLAGSELPGQPIRLLRRGEGRRLMAFEVKVTHFVPTSAGSKTQAREVNALMGLPEDAFLMENVDVTAFQDGRAIVTVQITNPLTAEEHAQLRHILRLSPLLTPEPPSR
jgi:hypothetical protein